MRRRDFIQLTAGATAWPFIANAQQALPVIGYLSTRSAATDAPYLTAFRRGLKEADHVEGQSVAIEYRFAAGQYDRLPTLVADLIDRQVAVIAAAGLPPALAAKAATTTIPIVFEMGADPIAAGLVTSLNRPGGNLTGVSRLSAELVPKRFEILCEAVPNARVIAILVNSVNPQTVVNIRDLEIAAGPRGKYIQILKASSDAEIATAFARLQADALLVGNDPFLNSRTQQVAALAVRYAIPSSHQLREFAAAGGLLAYSTSLSDSLRLLGKYAAQIVSGAKPADLPVQQSTKVELIVNLKTAKTLGLTVPPSLLARADEVIE